MLYEIMKHIKNFFQCMKMKEGNIEIKDGTVSSFDVEDGDYILIEGSKRNDGIYQCPCTLKDETFSGSVSIRGIPQDFLNLASEIETFTVSNETSAITSESFGGYTYSKATNSSGVAADWKDVFRGRLNTWRKI